MKRILVVDDNAINRLVAGKLLETAGYRVDVASNGQQAVKACTEHRYDLVLMDCQMPAMEGREAARQIRALAMPQPVIIAFTSLSLAEAREQCMGDDLMNGYLSKPYSDVQLLKLVREILVSGLG